MFEGIFWVLSRTGYGDCARLRIFNRKQQQSISAADVDYAPDVARQSFLTQ